MAFTTLGLITPHAPIELPEVGRERAEVTAATTAAMRTCAGLLERFAPDAIVLMSPHAPVVRDALLVDTAERYRGDFAGFGAPDVRFDAPGDPELGRAILQRAAVLGVPVFDRGSAPGLDSGTLDHGAMVPLAFLDRQGRIPMVEVSLAFVAYELHAALGRAIAAAAGGLGRRVAFIASGDMSHRLTRDAPAGFAPDAAEFDAEVVRLVRANELDALSRLDPVLVEDAGECGLRSWITLGGFLEGTGAATRVLAYEGPWGVGYMTAVAADPEVIAELPEGVTPPVGRKGGMPGDDESAPVALARHTIATYVRYGTEVDPGRPDDELLSSRAGAFVSLHSGNGALLGCIGTIVPTQPTLAAEIVHNAIQAASCDPRFPPLTEADLGDLDISVDVLHPAEGIDSLVKLDPKRYGVIVTAGYRRGLLLPDLEGVDTAEQQVAIAMQKAGIGPGEPVALERFRVDRYH